MQAPAIAINRGNVGLWIGGAVGLLLLGMVVAGYDLWSSAYYYASTDNAHVEGTLVQVGAPGPAQVADLAVQVGESVAAGQSVATLQLSGSVGRTNVHLRSPKAGTVVSLPVRAGQLVDAGDAVVVLTDPDTLWVVANVDENSLKGVQAGQPAEVTVNLLNRTMPGRVGEILPEFASSPAAAGASPGARASTLIPVRVEVEGDRVGLHPGMSAYVRIRIR